MIKKDSRILITGGSGLVGQNLTERLIKEGYTDLRVNLHIRGVRKVHDSVNYTYHDLQTYDGCKIATVDVDVVFHHPLFQVRGVLGEAGLAHDVLTLAGAEVAAVLGGHLAVHL